MLDIGAQTVLVPMMDTADDARRMVNAQRYPLMACAALEPALNGLHVEPRTQRYCAGGENLCLLVQIESRKALENLDEIIKVIPRTLQHN